MAQEHYEVIARKWRPQGFDDVIGQHHITDTLKNEISSGRIAHAFLFSGIRGIGKTSTARILAKALNCQQTDAPTPTPCNQCDSCRAITQGTATDVMEIDGASNRKIEHIRELRENIKFAPSRFRFKIYIIDEVHMLTREAFNALLKTLEEPPQHAIFILATTDAHKVPITISSRCQRFNFRRVGYAELANSLRAITAVEGVEIDEQSLLYIARRAEGSVRDAQSILEQVIAYCGKTVVQEHVADLLGIVGSESIQAVAEALLSGEAESIFKIIHGLVEQGHDVEDFYQDLLEHFRNLLVIRVSPEASQLVENSMIGAEGLQTQVKSHTFQELQMLLKFLIQHESQIKHSAHPRFSLEVVLLQASQIRSLLSFDSVMEKVTTLGEKFSSFQRMQPASSEEQQDHTPVVIDTAHKVFQSDRGP